MGQRENESDMGNNREMEQDKDGDRDQDEDGAINNRETGIERRKAENQKEKKSER